MGVMLYCVIPSFSAAAPMALLDISLEPSYLQLGCFVFSLSFDSNLSLELLRGSVLE